MGRPAASEVEPKPAALVGHRVSFTGRLATLSREQAADFVRAASGELNASVNARTTLLVVGVRGWPLLESGRITQKLAAAEKLRAAGTGIRIVSEDEFRELIGLARAPDDAAAKSLGLEQVARTLGLLPTTIERWEQLGLVRARDGKYDFRDLVSLRAVTELVARGVSPMVIRRSLGSLAQHLPGIDRPLAQLNILVRGEGELVAELEEALLTPSGQLELLFEPHQGARAAQTLAAPPAADEFAVARASQEPDWVNRGLAHERAGEWAQAEAAYRAAAARTPSDATTHFNLGNVLLRQGKPEGAAERFAHATALDPTHALAWFNLAHAQEACARPRAAFESLRRAVEADPTYADAHFNLADLAERLNETDAARRAWAEYLRLDPMSEWSVEARRRLRELKGAAWA